MEDLLEVEVGVASMADMLAEVFTGGAELCLKVREDQVARVFSIIAREELPEGRPELLQALQAMAKVGILLIEISLEFAEDVGGGMIWEPHQSIYAPPT